MGIDKIHFLLVRIVCILLNLFFLISVTTRCASWPVSSILSTWLQFVTTSITWSFHHRDNRPPIVSSWNCALHSCNVSKQAYSIVFNTIHYYYIWIQFTVHSMSVFIVNTDGPIFFVKIFLKYKKCCICSRNYPCLRTM